MNGCRSRSRSSWRCSRRHCFERNERSNPAVPSSARQQMLFTLLRGLSSDSGALKRLRLAWDREPGWLPPQVVEPGWFLWTTPAEHIGDTLRQSCRSTLPSDAIPCVRFPGNGSEVPVDAQRLLAAGECFSMTNARLCPAAMAHCMRTGI